MLNQKKKRHDGIVKLNPQPVSSASKLEQESIEDSDAERDSQPKNFEINAEDLENALADSD